ncbi:MAG TPA: TauD/TfdA family dioxygenase [Bryobacteraceae bacterium]|nr:TauD/TfdA family dioxygenase [Bryobacteraceae bacterium]
MHISPTPVHTEEILGPGAWTGSDFPDATAWHEPVSPAAWRELDRALRAAREKGRDLASAAAEDFVCPALSHEIAELRQELKTGRGFAVVKGLPLERYSEEEASLLYWGLGTLIGSPLPQNVRGDRLYSVRDEGYKIEKDYGAVGVRFSKTTEGLHFHTDSAPALMGNTPDVVGLLALEVAKAGGASALVSAQTVHNVIRRERPDYLRRLYASYHFDRRAELRPGEPETLLAPIFTYRDTLAVRYFRFYIPKGHELKNLPLEPADTEPLDFLDTVMNREELQVRFEMERGDMQFVSNRFVLHSRTAFEDYPEPDRRRHLKRLWLQFRES